MLAIFLSCIALGNAQSQAPGCPQITCVMFCANGIKKDANGCNTCSCATTPGQGVAMMDCSQAPGWGWCPAYSQCVNPAVHPCPGGVTSTPSVGSGGSVGVLPNPSVHTTTAAVGSHVGVSLPADLPQQLSASQVDIHGCPSNYPWCASTQSCSIPSLCEMPLFKEQLPRLDLLNRASALLNRASALLNRASCLRALARRSLPRRPCRSHRRAAKRRASRAVCIPDATGTRVASAYLFAGPMEPASRWARHAPPLPKQRRPRKHGTLDLWQAC